MTEIRSAAPQLLVRDLDRALAFYGEGLGFGVDFVHDAFYASVSRGGATIHLKCAPLLEAEREHRKGGDHRDVMLEVTGLATLYEELTRREVNLAEPLSERPWGTTDFTVEDPDGYLLCFSEPKGAD